MRPKLNRSLLGGLVATAAITLVMYLVAPAMTGQPMDVAQMLARLTGAPWGAGMALHILLGIVVFPLAYMRAYPYLRGRPFIKGIEFGIGLWFVAEALVVPLAGGGFFHAHLGGSMAVLASILGHAVYGVLLGWIAGYGAEGMPMRHVTADTENQQRKMAGTQ